MRASSTATARESTPARLASGSRPSCACVQPTTRKACFKKFGEIPQIIEIYRVTGEDCFVLKVLVPRPEELEAIVDRIASYGTATTSLVLRSEPPRAIGRELLGHRPT